MLEVNEDMIKSAAMGPDSQIVQTIEEVGLHAKEVFPHCEYKVSMGLVATMQHQESESVFHFLRIGSDIAILKEKKGKRFAFLLQK
jgi:hypothetical protein